MQPPPSDPDPESIRRLIDDLLAADDGEALAEAVARQPLLREPQVFAGLLSLADQARLKGSPAFAAALLSRLWPLAPALHPDQPEFEVHAALLLGVCARHLGHLDVARHACTEGLGVAERTGNDLGRANTLMALGDLERHLGNLAVARERYDQALPLFVKEQSDLGRANTLKALGDLERHLGNLAVARERYDQALPLHEKESDRLGQTNTLWSLGTLLDGADAIGRLEHAVAVAAGPDADSLLPPEEAARAWHSLAQAERARGRHVAARAASGRAVEATEAARRLIRGGWDRERHAAWTGDRYLLAARLALEPPGPVPAQALRYLELARHRTFQELMGDDLRRDLLRRLDPDLTAQLAALDAEIEALQGQIETAAPPNVPDVPDTPEPPSEGGPGGDWRRERRPTAAGSRPAVALRGAERAATQAAWRAARATHDVALLNGRGARWAAREALLELARRRNLAAVELAGGPLPPIDELLGGLPADTAAVFWALDEDGPEPWVAAVVVRGDDRIPHATSVQPLARPREIESLLLQPPDADGRRRPHLLDGYRAVPTPRPLAAPKLARLYELLITPLLPYLDGVRHVVMVPSGSLLLVPWAALTPDRFAPDPRADASRVYGWLDRPLSVVYAASVLHRLMGRAAPSGACPGVTLRDPGADRPANVKASSPSLPCGPLETEWVHDALGEGAQVIAGGAASRELLDHLGAPAGLWHHVGHAVFGGRDPWSSAVEWRGGGVTARQFLLGPDLPYPIALLSACETLVTATAGEAVAGLPRALLERGVRAVVGSLWRVDDLAAALFMGEVARRLAAHETVADAVASARAWLCRLDARTALDRLPPEPPAALDAPGQESYRQMRAYVEACDRQGRRPFVQPAYWAAWAVLGDGTALLPRTPTDSTTQKPQPTPLHTPSPAPDIAPAAAGSA